jgi:hypothetical protein
VAEAGSYQRLVLFSPCFSQKACPGPLHYATHRRAGLITSFETTPVGAVVAALPDEQRASWVTAVLTERLVVREWLFL